MLRSQPRHVADSLKTATSFNDAATLLSRPTHQLRAASQFTLDVVKDKTPRENHTETVKTAYGVHASTHLLIIGSVDSEPNVI